MSGWCVVVAAGSLLQGQERSGEWILQYGLEGSWESWGALGACPGGRYAVGGVRWGLCAGASCPVALTLALALGPALALALAFALRLGLGLALALGWLRLAMAGCG